MFAGFSLTFGQDTFVRKSKEKRVFLWYFAHLFVSFSHGKNRLHLRKTQINLVFRSICTIFAAMKRMTITLLHLLFVLTVWAYDTEPRIRHFNEHDGYEQTRVNYAIQDKKGYIWLSTWGGLCRYDGYRFTYYNDCQGAEKTIIKANTIFIRELENGSIEGIAKDSSFYVFHPREKRYELTKGDFQKTFKRCQVDSVMIRRIGILPQFKGKYFEILLTDRQGGVWVYTNSGLYRVYFERSPLKPQKAGNSVEEVVMALYTDRQGHLWVGDRNGYVRVKSEKTGVSDDKYLAPDGTLSSRPVRFGHDAYCFFEDSQGDMWIGTKPDGLFRWKRGEGKGKILHYAYDEQDSYSLSSNNVYAITEDDSHRLWIATFNGGLNVYTPKESRFINYRNTKGFFPSDGQSLRSYRVFISQQKLLMVGTDNGLYVTQLPASNSSFSSMNFKRYGLMVGSASSLGSNHVSDIEPIDVNITAIATAGGGISIVRNNELMTGRATFQRITSSKGLASNQCLALRQTSGRLYVVSYSSISRLSLKANMVSMDDQSNSQTDKEWSLPDGLWITFMYPMLASDYNMKEAKPAIGSDGHLFFGTTQGLLDINDSSLQKSDYCPNIVFDSPDTISLSADDHSLDIRFAALDYNTNSDIVYAYRFENNDNWFYTTENHIYLHDIKAGTHRLHLRSTNSDGVWVANERVLTIHRTPYFNETPWAWMLYGLLLTVFCIVVWRTVSYIRQLKRELKDIKLTKGQRIDMMADHVRELLSIRETVKPVNTDITQVAELPAEHQDSAAKMDEADQRFAKEAHELVMKNIMNTNYAVQDLAHDLLVSRNVLYARMKTIFGTSPYNYLLNVRIEESKKLLRGDAPYITDVAYRCGFSDPKYFSRCFKNIVGMTPSEYISRS